MSRNANDMSEPTAIDAPCLLLEEDSTIADEPPAATLYMSSLCRVLRFTPTSADEQHRIVGCRMPAAAAAMSNIRVLHSSNTHTVTALHPLSERAAVTSSTLLYRLESLQLSCILGTEACSAPSSGETADQLVLINER